jgi:hydrogenase maturation protease
VKARVVGCGQAVAGDDGVGLAVLAALAKERLPAGVQLCSATDGAALLPLLVGADRVIVVDAAVGLARGHIERLGPENIDRTPPNGASSHGIGVRQAIDLCRVLYPDSACADVRVIAIGIDQPERYTLELSPEVASAIPQALLAVRAWLDFSD